MRAAGPLLLSQSPSILSSLFLLPSGSGLVWFVVTASEPSPGGVRTGTIQGMDRETSKETRGSLNRNKDLSDPRESENGGAMQCDVMA